MMRPRCLALRLSAAAVLALGGCDGGPTEPAATQLAFAIQPTSTTAGSALAPAIRIEIRTPSGAIVSGSTAPVTVAIGANPGGGALSGQTTVSAVNGVATFSGLSINKAAAGYTLVASSGTLNEATSAAFAIMAGPPAAIAFSVQPPETAEIHLAFAPAVSVSVRDAFDNAVAGTVTIALGSNPSGATLAGTLTADAVDGVASFSDLRLDKTGAGYTLTAGVNGVTAESAPFTMQWVLAAITAGGGHTCAVTMGQVSYCWGRNLAGALGDSTGAESWVPVRVRGGFRFAVVSAGGAHTCGVTTAGVAYCWGSNDAGQLGNAIMDHSIAPVPVATDAAGFAAMSVGNQHSCGLKIGGAAYCWGRNVEGQLGDGSNTPSPDPVPVVGIANFAAISAGAAHTCGLTEMGAAHCWGWNAFHQLGDTMPSNSPAPVAVVDDHQFAGISAGSTHTCGRASGGATADAYCWGAPDGLGDTTDFFYDGSPIRVAGELAFLMVAAGGNFSCGVVAGGAAYCWGDDSGGKLGNGAASGTTTPDAVVGGIAFTTVTTGGSHACGLTAAGAAYCWGGNAGGRLGDGTTTDSPVPARVVDP